MPEVQGTRRMFLALWPSGTVREHLVEWQRIAARGKSGDRHKARAVPAANLHITLHFLGPVTVEQSEGLAESLDRVSGTPFELRLDRWGCFPKAGILYLGASEPPRTLAGLELDTRECVQQCFEAYQQKKFIPHVTLFRKWPVQRLPEAGEPVTWLIDRFVLVESITDQRGAVYQIAHEWKLGNQGQL